MIDILFFDSLLPPKVSGIYAIINRNNLKIYIGSALNFQHRKRVHKSDFVKQKHSNKYFQRAVNQSPESFEFTVIEIVLDKLRLIEREQFWINFYRSYDPRLGYNLNPNAKSRLGCKSGPISEELRSRKKEASKRAYLEGRWVPPTKGKSLPQYHRDAISKANKGRKFTLGRKMPDEEKQRRSLIFKGRTFSPEWRRKISESNKGRKPAPHTIEASVRARKIKAGLILP